MSAVLKKRKGTGAGRLLFILLLTGVFLLFGTVPGRCEDRVQAMNASGNLNRKLSVDPISNSEGFSAVLYNNSNGLPTSDANAIAQTGEGFFWIGSYAGLIRYDGNTFERIDSTSGIANVRCLFVDSRDRLWIGTNDAGVFLKEREEYRKWDKDDGLESISIRTITEDENGLIYIAGAASGIAVIDSGMKLTLIEDERIDGKTIPVLLKGNDGLVYGLTQEGDLFTLKDGKLVTFLGHEECRVQGAHSILPDPEHPGFLYVGTENSEICHGSLETNFSIQDTVNIAPLSSVNCMEYIQGQIWICTETGIGRIAAGGFRLLDNVPMNNSAEHVMTDYEGNLWFVSSHQGVMKIVRNQFSDLFKRYNLSEEVVNSTCMYGQRLFIGTDTGLIVLEGGKRVKSIPLTKAVTASGEDMGAEDLLELLDGVRIRSIIRDSRGRLWIPTWRRYGLLRYDRGELMAFTEKDGLFSDAVRVVAECEDGTIIASNTGGVSVIRDDRVINGYGQKEGINNGSILTLTEGFRHERIFGSDGDGIYVVGPGGTKRIGMEDGLMSEIILRIKRSTSGDFYWIVTGNSLAFMTRDYKVTTIRQFPYPNNYDLYENSRGDLWVLSSAGIYVVPGQELLEDRPVDPVFFGMQSGLPYVATANSLSELTKEGDLYMASTEGVVRVNIEKPFEDISELKISLPYVVGDDVYYYPDEEGRFSIPGNIKKLTLFPYIFNYSLIDPQVSYHLKGFDPADTVVSRSRLLPVDYTNLKLGSYEFVMKVKDSIGRTEQTVSFPINKGKEISVGTIGTVIMNAASLLLMVGILLYTALYRKRDRLEDRLFFVLILSNMILAAGELLSYLLEYAVLPFSKALMIAGNTVFYIMLVVFPYLFMVYLDYLADPDQGRMQKKKLLLGIPCFLFALLMFINLKTGWIFSIREGNVYHFGLDGALVFLPVLPVWFYFLLSLFKMYRINKRLVVLSIVLLGTRLVWELWYRGISSTSFLYTLFLMCMHLYVMNRPLYEEAL